MAARTTPTRSPVDPVDFCEEQRRKLEAEEIARAPCPFCCPELYEPCAECGRRGVKAVEDVAPPGFKIEDTRQRLWDAREEDMLNPCPEDR